MVPRVDEVYSMTSILQLNRVSRGTTVGCGVLSDPMIEVENKTVAPLLVVAKEKV